MINTLPVPGVVGGGLQPYPETPLLSRGEVGGPCPVCGACVWSRVAANGSGGQSSGHGKAKPSSAGWDPGVWDQVCGGWEDLES